jgi:serine/threonine protein kinase
MPGGRDELTQVAETRSDATEPTRRPEPGSPRGDAVGRYVAIRPLGAGGMGVVFAAYDPELDRKVAIKLLHSHQESGHRRLLREARALARLSHPNVVAIHDVGEHAGRVFPSMEFVDGRTLRDWLAAAPRGPREVLEVFIPAARGLAAAHEKGLVHRDFKPENVMLGADGRVRVMDFGLARPDASESAAGSSIASEVVAPHVDALGGHLTEQGSVVGTPGRRSTPARSARWALPASRAPSTPCAPPRSRRWSRCQGHQAAVLIAEVRERTARDRVSGSHGQPRAG